MISAPAAATTPQNFPVTLDVGDAPATLMASTGTLAFSWVTGQALPASQPIVLMSSGGALSASITVSGGTWLRASPTGSITLVRLPGTVTVTLDVTAGVPTSATNGIWPPGVLVNSPATIVTITGTNYFPTSVASAGTTPLVTTVLSPSAMLATIPAALLTAAGNLSITVATPTAAAPSAAATFVVYPPGPQVWAVANAASYTSATVSPGAIVTIYGIGLGPANLTVFPGTDPIPTSLPATGAATSVTVDAHAAPLGNAVPVMISAGAAQSQARVTMVVK